MLDRVAVSEGSLEAVQDVGHRGVLPEGTCLTWARWQGRATELDQSGLGRILGRFRGTLWEGLWRDGRGQGWAASPPEWRLRYACWLGNFRRSLGVPIETEEMVPGRDALRPAP